MFSIAIIICSLVTMKCDITPITKQGPYATLTACIADRAGWLAYMRENYPDKPKYKVFSVVACVQTE